ncbi:unnamed protein product [Tetraodon nigroviridis]|uniref:(spotted green pufferfish) hypothetical protein n=1 Tax=Tetraodon nigroviridis TaxID=99883 RepID=Q4T990_TETNG|nr:unnamed protein product [Tetraodon nigroviridis]
MDDGWTLRRHLETLRLFRKTIQISETQQCFSRISWTSMVCSMDTR